jgi:hypothetical protein
MYLTVLTLVGFDARADQCLCEKGACVEMRNRICHVGLPRPTNFLEIWKKIGNNNDDQNFQNLKAQVALCRKADFQESESKGFFMRFFYLPIKTHDNS